MRKCLYCGRKPAQLSDGTEGGIHPPGMCHLSKKIVNIKDWDEVMVNHKSVSPDGQLRSPAYFHTHRGYANEIMKSISFVRRMPCWVDGGFIYTPTQAGRERIIADLERQLKVAREILNLLPKEPKGYWQRTNPGCTGARCTKA